MNFDIPVVLFFMKRTKSTLQVLKGIAEVKPQKLYLVSDAGRNKEEMEKVLQCRRIIEQNINWPCEIVKDYAEENKGVLDRIGYGARRIFEKEEYAIFLEDDNVPDKTFFYFCKEMLLRYKNASNVLWICGTNYLEEYKSPYGHSYVFTKHMLPCGWASWSDKFLEMYDPELKGLNVPFIRDNYKGFYNNIQFEKQRIYSINATRTELDEGNRKVSWDNQMTFTLMSNRVYGIAPCVNLIKNIGVDKNATHGGTSYRNPMTRRFCGIKTKSMQFPLVHPEKILEDKNYEEIIRKIKHTPWWYMIGIKAARIIRNLFGIPKDVSFSKYIFR